VSPPVAWFAPIAPRLSILAWRIEASTEMPGPELDAFM
jgi:hypothetical protein